jgi:uncharacterized membrane protein YsdA (DUF1294 family)
LRWHNPATMVLVAILIVYLIMSGVTIGYYGLDKHRAANGGWRVPERTLHTLELLGGWPGALVGQQLFKHKRHKTSFMLIFWGIVVLHVGAWALIVWLRIK